MRAGTRLHAELEAQTSKLVEVQVDTWEDFWAVSLGTTLEHALLSAPGVCSGAALADERYTRSPALGYLAWGLPAESTTQSQGSRGALQTQAYPANACSLLVLPLGLRQSGLYWPLLGREVAVDTLHEYRYRGLCRRRCGC